MWNWGWRLKNTTHCADRNEDLTSEIAWLVDWTMDFGQKVLAIFRDTQSGKSFKEIHQLEFHGWFVDKNTSDPTCI